MDRLERLRLVCTPSLLSGTIVVALALFTLASNAWIYIDDSRLFYDELFGGKGVITVLLQTPTDVLSLLRSAFTSSATYYATLGVFSLIVVFVVYEALLIVDHVQSDIKEMQLEAHVAGLAYGQTLKEWFETLGIRLLACCAWALYWLMFIKLLLPFGIILLQNGIDSIVASQLNGWFGIGVSAGFLIIVWHIHTIFIRFVALRLRLFTAVIDV